MTEKRTTLAPCRNLSRSDNAGSCFSREMDGSWWCDLCLGTGKETVPMIEVVSGVIVRAGRVLLTQRPWNKDYPFSWETPGGKVEGNESHHDALRRELREELGLNVGRVAETSVWCGEIERPGRAAVFILFYVVAPDCGVPLPREGQGLGWFTAHEMSRLSLAPGNLRALPTIARVLGAVLPPSIVPA